MIIKKIAKIDNVFSFFSFNWDEINVDRGNNSNNPDDNFKKYNIFFAENGSGKSKLVDIFKSLNGESIELKRNWDRPPNDKQYIKVILDDESEIEFDNSQWTNGDKLKRKFLIFDKYFVDKYVHAIGPEYIDSPQRRQQRGRSIIFLGNFNDYHNEIEKINNLKSYISEKNRLFLEKERISLETILRKQSITVDQLEQDKELIKGLREDDLPVIKQQLKNQNDILGKIDKALKKKSELSKISLLSRIEINFSLEIQTTNEGTTKINPIDLFSFTISRGIQQTLHKIAHKKDFIKHGLSLITKETNECPFCEQKIRNGDFIQIIKDYQNIFNETFFKEEQKVKTLLRSYRRILENLLDLQSPLNNQTGLQTIKSFIAISIDDLPEVKLSTTEKTIVRDELNLVLKKERKILDKIGGTKFKEIERIIDRVNRDIKKYNELVDDINRKVRELQKDIETGKLVAKKAEIENKIKDIEKKLFYAENKKSLENFFKAKEQYNKNNEIVESLEKIYQLLKEKIVEQFNEFVSEYFSLIKQFVKEISPSMDIFEIQGQATYDRRNPRNPAQCGFRVEYNGEDRTSKLSEGEKQVIALAFFFARLQKLRDKNKIIVFDDPITSFDAGKRKSTSEIIERETKDFSQVFIFTCDPLFREYCLKQISNRNFYYIFKTFGASSIHHYKTKDSERFINLVCDKFEEDFNQIDSVSGSDENIIVFGQKLRFCLETKIKEGYFGYSEDKLSNMIEKVAKNGTEKFERLINNKRIILEIYNYCNTGGLAHYPKDGSTSWNELKGKIKQYLGLNL
ncbi:MAG: hypothetical protein KatS3mg090_0472 [Patescibacteria group bacterium]|nr:MAG: hypothetical protein KatS3mg090_0472 [Patescibacteria group bacterium]